MSRLSFHVRPRYTSGSPAMVHDYIAERVAGQERGAFEAAIDGVWGERERERAKLLGLRGIAYSLEERGRGRQFRWIVRDLITGETFERLHDQDIERAGFTPFDALPDGARREVVQTGNPGDYARTYWKREVLAWTKYEPKRVDP